MKKYITGFLSLAMILILFSCKKEAEIWNSSTTESDGNWYVRYDHATFGEDPWATGYVTAFTYNTAANNGMEIWLESHNWYIDYKVRIPVNTQDLTFGGTDTVADVLNGHDVLILNGKIIKDAVTLPSTLVVDSIYFELWFDGLEAQTGIASDRVLVGGYAKTGFAEDIR